MLVRAARFVERRCDRFRRKVARVDDLCDLSKLTTARVASHNCGADAEFLAFSSDGDWTNETRTPSFFKTDQERFLRFAAYRVEHWVTRLPIEPPMAGARTVSQAEILPREHFGNASVAFKTS
jgi:hypothetical protein